MYKLKCSYQTGNSFNTERCEEHLEYEWKDIKLAEEALIRIQEHYEWYESINSSSSYSPKTKERPGWHKKCFPTGAKWEYESLIMLRLDNGTIQFKCPWCGYFETLHEVSIVLDKKITFH